MGLSSRLLRLPRPQKFLYTMSLSTGASLITLSLLLNKVSGLYGILALFTGYHLSPFQLSMYIYSIFALALTAYLAPHIRTHSPLHCLALAWFYVLDSVINAAYTAAFGVTWFLVLAQHNASQNPASAKGPGAATINSTSGFTSPELNISDVEVVASATAGFLDGQDAVAPGTPSSAPAGADGTLGNAVLSSESMNSMGIIIALWTIRLYFCVIMLAYARFVLRQHIAYSSTKNNTYTSASPFSDLAENPFSVTRPEGQGWRGKLGRAMVAMGRSYWLGSDGDNVDNTWMSGMGGKFSRRNPENGQASNTVLGKGAAESGPAERERRRRSGTGPPLPQPTLVQAPGQQTLSIPLQNL